MEAVVCPEQPGVAEVSGPFQDDPAARIILPTAGGFGILLINFNKIYFLSLSFGTKH